MSFLAALVLAEWHASTGLELRKLCKLDEAVPKRNTLEEGKPLVTLQNHWHSIFQQLDWDTLTDLYTLVIKISMLRWKVRLTIYPDFVVVRSPVVNAECVTGHDLKMELIWNGSDVL